MKSYLRKYLYFLLAGLTYLIIHEGVHVILANIFGVFEGIKILPFGVEVEITQPLTIDGIRLALFSGLSSITTIVIGYVLLLLTPKILSLKAQPIKNYIYYVTFIFLLLDPVYISILSFLVSGDINGIALGLNLPFMAIRGVYFIAAAFNGYLVYKKLYPAYVIKWKTKCGRPICRTGREIW